MFSPAWKAARSRARLRRGDTAARARATPPDGATLADAAAGPADARPRRPAGLSESTSGPGSSTTSTPTRCSCSAPAPPASRRRSATRTARWATASSTGSPRSGSTADDRFQIATPPVAHPRAAQHLSPRVAAGATRPPAPAVRPRRVAAPHRGGTHHARDGGRPDRAGMANHPRSGGLRPLLAALHHVGRDAGGRGGRAPSPAAPACAGSPPTAPARCR